jgi:hypothetical protein
LGLGSGDEHLLYIRGRKLSAMDAMWQVMGFHTYPASTPSVRLVKAKMPIYLIELDEEGKLCDLLVYFSRRDSEREVVFTKWFDEWEYSFKPPK